MYLSRAGMETLLTAPMHALQQTVGMVGLQVLFQNVTCKSIHLDFCLLRPASIPETTLEKKHCLTQMILLWT